MRPRVRRLYWFLLAIVAVVVARRLGPWVQAWGQEPTGGEAVPAGRDWRDVEATLDLEEESLHLRGSWSGWLPAAQADPVTFLLDRELCVMSVTVDGQRCEEEAPALGGFLALPRDRRVHPLPAGFLPAGDLVHVEIEFHGRALSVAADRGLPGPPVVFSGARPYLPWVGSASLITSMTLTTPKGWPVTAAVPAERVDDGTAKGEIWRLTCGETLPAFVLGPMHESAVQVDPGRRLGIWSDTAPDHDEASAAAATLERWLPGRLPGDQTVVLVSGLPEAAEGRMGPDSWMFRTPRLQAEWVRLLAAVALGDLDRPRPRPLAPLPEILGALSLTAEDPGAFAEQDYYRRHHGKGADASVLEAWFNLALRHPQVDLVGAVQRWLADPDARGDWESILGDPAAARTAEWVAAGVDVRLEDLGVRATGNRFELVGRVHVQPPAPAGLSQPVDIFVVGLKQRPRFRVETDGEWTTFRESGLSDRPRRVELDPDHVHPDRDRHDNAVSLWNRLDPSAFAVTDDSSLLAVVPEPNHLRWPYGVYLWDLREGTQGEPRWMEVEDRVVSMEWVGRDRERDPVLLLEQERPDGTRVRTLLDGDTGRTRRFSGQVAPAPEGGLLLLQEERRPGRYRHAFYWIATHREVPFLNEYPGALRWTRNANFLVAEMDDGMGALLDTAGRRVAGLGGLFFGRDVRRMPLGMLYVTDGATTSQLHEVDLEDRVITRFPDSADLEEGRILDYFLTRDPERIFVYLELPGDAPDRYCVYRITPPSGSLLLYKGSHRPLAELHSQRGAILADPSPSLLGEDEGIVRLSFFDYEQTGGEVQEPRVICEDAHLEPRPVLSSERYLYYIRSEPDPQTAPARSRPRLLYRYDFLTGREERLFNPRG